MKTIGPFVAVLALVFTSCSSSIPSPSEGRRVIEDRIKRQSNGLIKLVSFEKTNGQPMDFMGAKAYRLEFKAVIEFLDDCLWFGGYRNSMKGDADGFKAERPTRADWDEQRSPLSAIHCFRRGERVTITSAFHFEQTERGWRLAE